jgi:hypothetical protein
MEPQSVSALPFRVGFRREGDGPAKIIPVGHVLADADDQLARIGVLSIDLPKQCIRRGQSEQPADVNSSTRTAPWAGS